MKHIVLLVSLAIASAAWGQAQKPAAKEPAKPTAQEAAKPAPMKEAAKPAAEPAKQAAVARKPRRWHEDARHCLERPTNTEVIKCAEEFL